MVIFWLFAPNLWEVVGTYESFFCHSMNASSIVRIPRGGGDTQTLLYANNLFQLIALKDNGGGKTSGVSTHAHDPATW